MAARRDGLDPSYAIDLVLAVLAREFGKPVTSLETPEVQIAALQMPTQAETIDFVSSSLDDLESGRTRPMLSAHRQASGPTATSPSSNASSAGATASTPRPSGRR